MAIFGPIGKQTGTSPLHTGCHLQALNNRGRSQFFYVFEMSRFVQPLKDKNLTDRTKANKMKSTDDQKPDIQQYW